MELFYRGPGQSEPDPDPFGKAVGVAVTWMTDVVRQHPIRPEDLWELLEEAGFKFKVEAPDGREVIETAPSAIRESGIIVSLDVLNHALGKGWIDGDSRSRRYWRPP